MAHFNSVYIGTHGYLGLSRNIKVMNRSFFHTAIRPQWVNPCGAEFISGMFKYICIFFHF